MRLRGGKAALALDIPMPVLRAREALPLVAQ